MIDFCTIASHHVLQRNLQRRLQAGPRNRERDWNAQVGTRAVNREED